MFGTALFILSTASMCLAAYFYRSAQVTYEGNPLALAHVSKQANIWAKCIVGIILLLALCNYGVPGILFLVKPFAALIVITVSFLASLEITMPTSKVHG